MKFRSFIKKHPELEESGFMDQLRKKPKEVEALFGYDWPEETWNNVILAGNTRFIEERKIKNLKAAERKAAKEREKKGHR